MSFIHNDIRHSYIQSILKECSYLKNKKQLVDCIKELETRHNYLSNSKSKKANKLANKLASCDIGTYCKSAACPICSHINKTALAKDIMDKLEQFNDLRFVTLVFLCDSLEDGELLKYDINNLINKFYKKLQRIGYNGIAIGSLEADFHSYSKRWMLHFHLLMEYDTEAFTKLRNFMKRPKNMNARDGVKNRPMHVGMLRNPEKQITYIFKTQWKRIELYQGCDGQRRTKDYRLRKKQFIQALIKLDKVGLSGLRFMYGITRSKSGLSLKRNTK